MGEPKEIKISYEAVKSLVEALEYIDLSNYSSDYQNLFESVLEPFKSKIKAVEKRQAYSELIQANKTGNEDAALDARIEYLKKRSTT